MSLIIIGGREAVIREERRGRKGERERARASEQVRERHTESRGC